LAAVTGQPWRVDVMVPADRAEAVETALEHGLEDILLATARMLRGDAWLVQALCSEPPGDGRLHAVLAGFGRLEPIVAQLPDADWVAEGLKHLPPVHCGRVRVIGGHHPPPRSGTADLLIDAGPAFGTGQHATTRGCLLALDRLARGRPPRRVLDLGCGTAILAMAAARLWRAARPASVASDIDPPSVLEARRNLRRNGLARAAAVVAADGFRHPLIRRHAPYDLAIANILALPLIRFAPQVRRHLVPGGVVILSGLLDAQEPAVRNAYRAAGFILIGRIRLPGWPTLLMRRR